MSIVFIVLNCKYIKSVVLEFNFGAAPPPCGHPGNCSIRGEAGQVNAVTLMPSTVSEADPGLTRFS